MFRNFFIVHTKKKINIEKIEILKIKKENPLIIKEISLVYGQT